MQYKTEKAIQGHASKNVSNYVVKNWKKVFNDLQDDNVFKLKESDPLVEGQDLTFCNISYTQIKSIMDQPKN